MTSNDLFEDFKKGFSGRRFSAGLLIAFIDFIRHLKVPGSGIKSFADFLKKHPRQTKTSAGKRANTLIVEDGSGNTISLRPFYNKIEKYFRAEHKRFDYPSCAPHATQAWNDYERWLDGLVQLPDKELLELRELVCKFVLDKLVDQTFDPSSVKVDPPLFKLLLEKFDLTAKRGEPTGAAYQGMVFGFLRADNPHLQIEISKVRTGSKRLQRVGDVDGWEGARLAVSCEVKQLQIKKDDVSMFEAFAHEVGKRGAVGIVAALSFQDEARANIESLGLKARDTEDFIDSVELWDPMKQRVAITSFEYYVRHVEKNASLSGRLKEFMDSHSSK